MGGNNETRLPGPANLRVHESGGDVHVHDDLRGTKFYMLAARFKTEYARMRAELEKQKPPYEVSTSDQNGVWLFGELDGQTIIWSLVVSSTKKITPAVPATLAGFAELDSFVGSL